MRIGENIVASFHYTLKNDAGEVLDSSQGREPLAYLHGVGNIVEGLEKAMEGRGVGDKFSVSVAPEEGYGVHHEQLTQQVPREAFQGGEQLEVGMHFQASGEQGVMEVRVTAIEGDVVTVDGNHPLAGETLHFDIEVTDTRAATAEETAHGHVHGPGGHHHD